MPVDAESHDVELRDGLSRRIAMIAWEPR